LEDRHCQGNDRGRDPVIQEGNEMKEASDAQMEKEIRRLEEGEAWEPSDEPVQLEARTPLDKVVPIRLSARHWEDLRRIAGELGLGPTTLARVWIMERLSSRSLDSVLLRDSGPTLRQGLTPRELEILKQVSQGRTSRQIAERLGINAASVAVNLRKIRHKLGSEYARTPQQIARGPVSQDM
jgi:DNA-binding CsgD family transcriptional regulator